MQKTLYLIMICFCMQITSLAHSRELKLSKLQVDRINCQYEVADYEDGEKKAHHDHQKFVGHLQAIASVVFPPDVGDTIDSRLSISNSPFLNFINASPRASPPLAVILVRSFN